MTTANVNLSGDTTLVSQAPTTNKGTDQSALIGWTTASGLYHMLGRADLSAYADRELDSATLTLTNSLLGGTLSSNKIFHARRLLQTAWTELGATWNTYDGSHSWGTAGANSTTTDYTATDQASATLSAITDNLVLDITDLAQDAIDFRASNLLNLIVMGDEAAQGDLLTFYTNDYGTPADRPIIAITYTPMPLIERIARRIALRLEQITSANGYGWNAVVDRPDRLGRNYEAKDMQVIVLQGERDRDVENSIEGNPCRDCWIEHFNIGVFSMNSDTDTTAVDKLLNIRDADLVKAITTPTSNESALSWWEFNGLAMNARMAPAKRSGFDQSPTVEVQLDVTWRTPENDPYTKG